MRGAAILIVTLVLMQGFLVLLTPATIVSPSIALNEKKLINKTFNDDTPGIQWSKQFGGIGQDGFRCVKKTLDGGYLLVGYSKSYSPNGFYAAWLVKTDAAGNEEWNHTYESYAVHGTQCQQTQDGGYAFCGVDHDQNIWLVKTDSLGIEQWNQTYGNGTAWCFQQTADGGYILSGFPMEVIRTNATGKVIWEKGFFDSTAIAESIQQTPDGGFIIAGRTDYNGFLLKLNPDGMKEWDIIFKATSDLATVLQTPDGGFLVSGYFSGYPWLVRTNQTGTELWNKTYPLSDEGTYDTILASDGGYAFVAQGDSDSCLVKTDRNGTEQWQIPFPCPLYSLQQANDGSFIIAGIDFSIDTMGNGILMKIGHIPHVEITKPTKALYLFGNKVMNFFMTMAIGRLTVEATAWDTKYSIAKVEFAVDGNLMSTDTTTPFTWTWTKPSFGRRMVEVTVFNSVGNCSQTQIDLIKFF